MTESLQFSANIWPWPDASCCRNSNCENVLKSRCPHFSVHRSLLLLGIGLRTVWLHLITNLEVSSRHQNNSFPLRYCLKIPPKALCFLPPLPPPAASSGLTHLCVNGFYQMKFAAGAYAPITFMNV